MTCKSTSEQSKGDVFSLTELVAGSGSYQIKLIRPLLQVRKQQLQEYCRQQGLTWVEDPTNQDSSYLRNLIRAQLASYNESRIYALHSEAASFGQKEIRQLGFSSKQSIQHDQQGLDYDTLPSGQPEPLLQPGSTAEAARLAGRLGGGLCAEPECLRGGGDIVRDVLLLTKVCSNAKQSMQMEADLLLGKVTQPAADRAKDNVSYPMPDTQQGPQTSLRRLSSREEGLGQLHIQNAADLGVQRHPCSQLDLGPFRGRKRSVIVRVLAQLLQVTALDSISFHANPDQITHHKGAVNKQLAEYKSIIWAPDETWN